MKSLEVNLKSLSALSCVALIALVSAGCSSSSSGGDDKKKSETSKSTFAIPSAVQASALPSEGTLKAYLKVDSGSQIEMTINAGQTLASITIEGLSVGDEHTFEVCFDFTSAQTNNASLVLTCATKQYTWETPQANTPIAFEDSDFVAGLVDTDGDGINNVDEIVGMTNPFSCVVRTAQLGDCSLGV